MDPRWGCVLWQSSVLIDYDAFAAPPANAFVQQLVEKGQLFK